jgi:hypothetical protein
LCAHIWAAGFDCHANRVESSEFLFLVRIFRVSVTRFFGLTMWAISRDLADYSSFYFLRASAANSGLFLIRDHLRLIRGKACDF